jgi:uncharacterized protein
MKKFALILVLLSLNFACARQTKIQTVAYVTDGANVIDPTTEARLEARLAQVRQDDGVDFAVVTVSTSGGDSVFDHSLRLARERSAVVRNTSGKGGLLLLVAVNDRQWRIQTTRNLEATLPAQLLTDLSTPMTDSFKQERYGEGIEKYVDAVTAKLKS